MMNAANTTPTNIGPQNMRPIIGRGFGNSTSSSLPAVPTNVEHQMQPRRRSQEVLMFRSIPYVPRPYFISDESAHWRRQRRVHRTLQYTPTVEMQFQNEMQQLQRSLQRMSFAGSVMTPTPTPAPMQLATASHAMDIDEVEGRACNIDYFSWLADEVILEVFKWLPKKSLLACCQVNWRFNRCGRDDTLWTRLDLGGEKLRSGAFNNILSRSVNVLRLTASKMCQPIFLPDLRYTIFPPKINAKLQYLDLSNAIVTKTDLRMLLRCCRLLRKLSLEHLDMNYDICMEISNNIQLNTLNLSMCCGLEAWAVRMMLEPLTELTSLNVSWTNLTKEAVHGLINNLSTTMAHLNLSGLRKTVLDMHIGDLAQRCPLISVLDLSDCDELTMIAIHHISTMSMLAHLAISRCYSIPAASFTELKLLPHLRYLDLFGLLNENVRELIESNFPNVIINESSISDVARPCCGDRNTIIWGQRTH